MCVEHLGLDACEYCVFVKVRARVLVHVLAHARAFCRNDWSYAMDGAHTGLVSKPRYTKLKGGSTQYIEKTLSPIYSNILDYHPQPTNTIIITTDVALSCDSLTYSTV